MKKIKNKWQIIWERRDVYEMMVPLLSDFTFGFVKLIEFPAEGAILEKKHYKGFLVTIRFYKLFEFRK